LTFTKILSVTSAVALVSAAAALSGFPARKNDDATKEAFCRASLRFSGFSGEEGTIMPDVRPGRVHADTVEIVAACKSTRSDLIFCLSPRFCSMPDCLIEFVYALSFLQGDEVQGEKTSIRHQRWLWIWI
jgi:hypothetical protein